MLHYIGPCMANHDLRVISCLFH